MDICEISKRTGESTTAHQKNGEDKVWISVRSEKSKEEFKRGKKDVGKCTN